MAIEAQINWEEASSHAQALTWLGAYGHLATITSQKEQDFIWNLFKKERYYLGGYQTSKADESDGNWAWVTGEEWSYTNWNNGEPSNNSGN